MSLVKDDYWSSEAQERNSSAKTARLPSIQLKFATPTPRFSVRYKYILRRIAENTSFRSVRTRLLLGSMVGPLSAYFVLFALAGRQRPESAFVMFVLATVLGLLITGLTTRNILRFFDDLAVTARSIEINDTGERLSEDGLLEVSKAAKAFNTMSERIGRQVDERIRLLTAFSHDIQTPITRMRLRVELAEQFPEQEKLLRDLDEAERLVRDGISYARNAHITHEDELPVDMHAFIESIVSDYMDTGRNVSVINSVHGIRTAKPATLRRILTNFIDNALKFTGAAEIGISENAVGELVIAVMDRGPGIAPDQIEAVMEPFVKLEHCSGIQTSGVGLGLAIARQLASEMNGLLSLENRPGGGLSAKIVFASSTPATM